MVVNPLHTTIDVILGKHLMTVNTSEQQLYIALFLKDLQDSYSILQPIKVVAGSWNLNGNNLKFEDVEKWL